jgi:hypothetical protein
MIISLQQVRELRKLETEDLAYKALILGMSKLELLEEMVRFQEERSRTGSLTLTMMVRGKHLFRALENTAETDQLRLLTRSYRRHLEHEIAHLLRGQDSNSSEDLASHAD